MDELGGLLASARRDPARGGCLAPARL